MPLFVPKDRKSLFRQFLSGMYDAVIITDPNGYVLEVNPRAEEYFDCIQDEVIDRHVSSFISGLNEVIVQRIRRGLEADRHVIIDANGLKTGGGKFSCEVSVSLLELSSPDDLVFTVRSTERRRQADCMFRMKANAFRIASSALFGCDGDGCLRYVNDAFLSLFALEDEEAARRRNLRDLLGDGVKDSFARALAGETVTVTCALVGNAANVRVTLAPDRQGRRICGAVGCLERVPS